MRQIHMWSESEMREAMEGLRRFRRGILGPDVNALAVRGDKVSSALTLDHRHVRTVCLLWALTFTAQLWGQSQTGLSLQEAVRITIERQPEILAQKQLVESARGSLVAAGGQFDSMLQAYLSVEHEDSPLTREIQNELQLSSLKTDTASYGIGVEKQFRTGLTLNPTISFQRIEDNSTNVTAPNYGTANLQITQPLMRGFGRDDVAAAERSAAADYRAAVDTLHHTMATDAVNAVVAYWDYVGYQQVLAARKETEELAHNLLDQTKALIEADQRPASEINKVTANLASATAQRISAEQDLYEAKQNLGLAIGLNWEEIEAMREPSDDFPEVDENDLPSLSSIGSFVQTALVERGDLAAARETRESARILSVGAVKASRPQLDLGVGLGFEGIVEGKEPSHFLTAFTDNVPGPSLNASLTFGWPFGNRSAVGLVEQNEAEHRQAIIAADDLARRIASSVAAALSSVRQRGLQLKKAEEAAAAYRVAVSNETQIHQAGLSTTLEVIQTEDLLSSALIDLVSARHDYAVAVALLRYQTGTLMRFDSSGAVTAIELMSLPSIEAPPE
ncbi:MAG: TolC family protein [Acidobacteriota bacterium]